MRRIGIATIAGITLLAGSVFSVAAQDDLSRVERPDRKAAPARTARPPARPEAPARPETARQDSSRPAAPAKSTDPAKSDRERDIAKATEPMRFQRVRSAASDCGDVCPEWISAEGRIMTGVTANHLKRMIAGLGDKKVPIFIHSAGGSVEEAYAMGRMIRAKGLPVSVTKTELTECAASDRACRALAARGIKYGTPKPPLSVCASSCVFVLAAGTERHVGPASLVGVHQYESSVTHVQVLQRYRMIQDPRTGGLKKEVISEERVGARTVKTRTKSEVYDKSASYFAEMGVTNKIMEPLLATPHTSMHWLTPSEIVASKIATDRKTGFQVIASFATADDARRDAEASARATAMAAASGNIHQRYEPSATAPVRADSGLVVPGAAQAGVKTTMLPPGPAPTQVYDPALVRQIQTWLATSNCLAAPLTGQWGGRSKLALAKLSAVTNKSFDNGLPTTALLDAVRAAVANMPNSRRVCETPVE